MQNIQRNEDANGAVLYEIRKDGVVCCASHLPLCGYSQQIIKEMQGAGFELYANGKKVQRGKR